MGLPVVTYAHSDASEYLDENVGYLANLVSEEVGEERVETEKLEEEERGEEEEGKGQSQKTPTGTH